MFLIPFIIDNNLLKKHLPAQALLANVSWPSMASTSESRHLQEIMAISSKKRLNISASFWPVGSVLGLILMQKIRKMQPEGLCWLKTKKNTIWRITLFMPSEGREGGQGREKYEWQVCDVKQKHLDTEKHKYIPTDSKKSSQYACSKALDVLLKHKGLI